LFIFYFALISEITLSLLKILISLLCTKTPTKFLFSLIRPQFITLSSLLKLIDHNNLELVLSIKSTYPWFLLTSKESKKNKKFYITKTILTIFSYILRYYQVRAHYHKSNFSSIRCLHSHLF
jgi:hypothetical protein